MSPEPEGPLCVLCRRRPVEERWRPFCSERCKLHDLGNWAAGTYRVAAEPVQDTPDAGEPESDGPD